MEGHTESEPFPTLNTSDEHFQSALAEQQRQEAISERAAARAAAASLSNGQATSSAVNGDDNTRRRRKSSALGKEIPAADTGAPALASSRLSMSTADRPGHITSSPTPSPGLAPPSKAADPTAPRRISKRRRARGVLRRIRQIMIKRTYTLPTFLLALFGLLYSLNPTESNPIHHFIFLSYRLEPGSGEFLAPAAGEQVTYGKGPWDIAFVAFYTIVLSFTREFIMQEILRPWARSAGIRSRGKQARFMEQAYTAIYFAFLGPAGMYVMKQTPVWYYNTQGMYENFPHRTHIADFKFYYLFQAAYWAQQAIVLLLGLEKPRKDFKELVAHHLCTLALIALSYRFHFTYMGIAVYITHDISDLFLATSKTMHYLDFPFTDPFFVVFIGVWVYLRHFINLKILWSIFTEFRTVGPFVLDWETQQYKCWISQCITFGLLAALQALNIFWLYYILRVAYRFIAGKNLEDERSEAEDNDEVEDEQQQTGAEKEKKALKSGSKKQQANGHATKANGVATK